MKTSSARLLVPFLLLFPMLMGSRCKKTPDTPPIESGPGDANPPEVELQVVSIDPSTADAGESFDARIYGSAFQSGARVLFGTNEGSRVDVLNSNTIKLLVPPLSLGVYDVTVTNPMGERAVLRRGLSVTDGAARSCSRLTVYFDFDRSDLTAEGLRVLASQAACLNQSRGSLRIEGHCDDRGTTEYNIALGQRRANAVQKYLTSQGISPGRMSTISYGEERPAVQGAGESTWARNRRAEILLGN
jgi:peptidoglycan-associated lipoprotein